MTMTDDQVRDQVERADRFVEQLRDAIAGTMIDPASLCADAQRRTLRRIAETLDAVEYVTFANLANLDAAMHGAADAIDRGRTDGVRRRSRSGLCRRRIVPAQVPADDRHGAQAARQLTINAGFDFRR